MSIGILLVDPQNDFFPLGSLAVKNGDEIIGPINQLLDRHPDVPVYVSRDWHPEETRHFSSGGGTWPRHCIRETPGAEFHKDLSLDGARVKVYNKGTDPKDDAGYSAFEGARNEDGNTRTLLQDLREEGVQGMLVAGLATDYCVKASVLDALKNGFFTFVFLPGVRAVNLNPEDGKNALEEMVSAGALLIQQ